MDFIGIYQKVSNLRWSTKVRLRGSIPSLSECVLMKTREDDGIWAVEKAVNCRMDGY